MTGDATYTAQYAEIDDVVICYIVDPSIPDTAGSVAPGSETLKAVTGKASGSVATANDGWVFTGWTLNGNAGYSGKDATLKPKQADVAGSTVWTERTYVAHFTRKTAELTIQKKWADGDYTDNRVPVTLKIYRKIDDNGAGEQWKSIALDDSKKLSTDASIWQTTESAETHDATNHPYTYYIESEVATDDADKDKLDTYYAFASGSGVVLTETDTNTLTGTNTLATKELTITKQLDASVPNSYGDAKFEFTVTKAGESAPVSGLVEKTGTGTRPIDKIELRKGESITLILPIGTYTVAEKLTTDQQEIWAQPGAQKAKLEKDGAHLTFTNRLTTAANEMDWCSIFENVACSRSPTMWGGTR